MEEIGPSEAVDGLSKEGDSRTRLNRPFLPHAARPSTEEAGGAGSESLLWWCSQSPFLLMQSSPHSKHPVLAYGATVTKDTTLGANIGPCSGDGLVIGANGITFNSAGHTINGTGTNDISAGISLTGVTRVTIKNCYVTEFGYGLFLNSSSSNTFSGNTANKNAYGFTLPTLLATLSTRTRRTATAVMATMTTPRVQAPKRERISTLATNAPKMAEVRSQVGFAPHNPRPFALAYCH
jgi:parallel beta-helix repeat protein